MGAPSILQKRKNGVYYTPAELARFLAEPLITDTDSKILDPSYGEGALLLAAESIFKAKSSRNILELYGSDIHPVNGLLKHLPAANLKEVNFFDYKADKEFDVVLTNPPYVKHQQQEKIEIKRYRKENPHLHFLSNSSDLWAYFLVKSVDHLKDNGSIGAILPWAFIQSDYSVSVREWLVTQFEQIRVLAVNNTYFEDAEERVILMWLRGHGKPNQSIEFASVKDFNDSAEFTRLTLTQWLAHRVMQPQQTDLISIFESLRKMNFTSFDNFASTRIGVVTGANDYFIKRKDEALALGFTERQLVPILTKANELSSFLRLGESSLKCLALIDNNNSEYIELGVKEKYNLRSHSKIRHPWYAVRTGSIPHAFFPYRVGQIPFLILNDKGVQSTNSIHRIYFKDLSKIQMMWISVSILSIYGQLSIESNAKTYGRGMIKIEPGALNKVLVFKGDSKTVIPVYNRVLELLKTDRKKLAVEYATSFLSKAINIPKAIENLAREAWREINESRSK